MVEAMSWKATHNFMCSQMSSERFEELNRLLEKITDSWQHARRGILERYCAVTLDLANNLGT